MAHLVARLAAITFIFAASPAFASNGPDLPDDSRTPGVANPDVTQNNIQSTICLSGWTATVRPPTAETNADKEFQLSEFGYADQTMSDFEEDHRVPLEIGGHPSDRANLWPQHYDGDWGARVKDKMETWAKRQICQQGMPLDAARALFTGNWIASFQKYCGQTDDSKCSKLWSDVP